MPQHAEPRLRAHDLNKTFAGRQGAVHAVKNVSFEIDAGESVALVGSSGSGKTTLLSLCAGLDRPTTGTVSIDGRPLSELDEVAIARLRNTKLGFVFQNYQLIPTFTALENVMTPAEIAGRSDARKLAADLLEQVGLSQRQEHYPSELSGGEQQRVAIARCFINNPAFILADEPTGNLDGSNRAMIADLLFAMNRKHGTALLIATHDMHLAERADRVLHMANGVLEQSPA